MSISRDSAAAYLSGLFVDFATEIGQISDGDSSVGYGPDIDNALRDLNVAETGLSTGAIAESNRRLYFSLLEYYAARRMWVRYSAKASSIRLGPQSVEWTGSQDAIKAIMDDAAGRAAAGGVAVDAGGVWTLSHINMDFLEPEPITNERSGILYS